MNFASTGFYAFIHTKGLIQVIAVIETRIIGRPPFLLLNPAVLAVKFNNLVNTLRTCRLGTQNDGLVIFCIAYTSYIAKLPFSCGRKAYNLRDLLLVHLPFHIHLLISQRRRGTEGRSKTRQKSRGA